MTYLKNTEKWKTVKPEFDDGKIFVNCGDYMSILSNGKFISPLHRVIPPSMGHKERLSFVLFFYPKYDATIPKIIDSDSNDIVRNQKHEYSLNKDQSQQLDDNTKMKNNKPNFDINMPFGAYIKQKWAQVARKH